MYSANVKLAVILQIILVCLYCTNDFLVDGQAQIETCWKWHCEQAKKCL